MSKLSVKCLEIILILLLAQRVFAFETFMPYQGGATEVWRITDDPAMRDWANYHNTDAFSPDGRYLCWAKWAYLTVPDHESELGKGSKVYIFDFKTKETRLLGSGSQPRWASRHNWLFFVQNGSDIIWYDADTEETKKLTTGLKHIGETDADDRWLYGTTARLKDRGPKGTIVRVPLEDGARPEVLPEARGVFYLPNPVYPKVLFRIDGLLPLSERKPFTPIHVMTDLDGTNEQMLSPELRHSHQTWSGDGEWFLFGNGQMRGRKWNEPFPSNLHYLAGISCGDISPCGRSGRWIIGGNNIGSMQVADLWCGDGRVYLRALSFVHNYGSRHANAMGDNDSKGSPDGTKVAFVTNYDLKNAPYTTISRDMAGPDDDRILVESTKGFPESGRISVQAEIIGYKRKTPTSFEGLTREMYGVRAENPGTLSYFPPALFKHYTDNRLHLKKGLIVTSFDSRLLTCEQRKGMIMPDLPSLPEGWQDNPVTWQRRADVHIAVIRKPDPPFFRHAPLGAREDIQLIPGENHRETMGYHIYKDGVKISDAPVRPGETVQLGSAAEGNAHLYITAQAVEWSGLESEMSIPFHAMGTPTLKILVEKPQEFSWTYERVLVNNEEISPLRLDRQKAWIKEIMHLYDGVISRIWYDGGLIQKQCDYNSLGQATRSLYFEDGILCKREYINRDGVKVSEEYFDKDGFITEARTWAYDLYLNDMVLAEPYLENKWFFDKGMPVKLIGSDSYERYSSFPGVYLKQDENWIKVKELESRPVFLK